MIEYTIIMLYAEAKNYNCLYVFRRPIDSPWTDGDKYTEVYLAIEFLEKWINDNVQSLPPFDHAMLFSGNELWNDYRSDGTRRTISGQLYINKF